MQFVNPEKVVLHFSDLSEGKKRPEGDRGRGIIPKFT
jgi:hypothetical protein